MISNCGIEMDRRQCRFATPTPAAHAARLDRVIPKRVRSRPMTQLFEKALNDVAKLPASEQDAVAAILLEELASERRQ
jgi:hypothetical protein